MYRCDPFHSSLHHLEHQRQVDCASGQDNWVDQGDLPPSFAPDKRLAKLPLSNLPCLYSVGRSDFAGVYDCAKKTYASLYTHNLNAASHFGGGKRQLESPQSTLCMCVKFQVSMTWSQHRLINAICHFQPPCVCVGKPVGESRT